MERGQLLHRLPAVDTLRDDLETVLGREDSRKAGSDDGLVVDESGADHRPTRSRGRRQVTSHPSGVGPAANSPPSAVARSCIPISPYRGLSRSDADATDDRSAGLCDDRDPTIGQLEAEDGSSTRRVASRIGKRFLRDPVDRKPDTGRDPIEVSLRAELDRETSCPCLIDQLRDLGRGGKRRCHARSRRRDGAVSTCDEAPACCDGPPPRPNAARPRPRPDRGAGHGVRSSPGASQRPAHAPRSRGRLARSAAARRAAPARPARAAWRRALRPPARGARRRGRRPRGRWCPWSSWERRSQPSPGPQPPPRV